MLLAKSTIFSLSISMLRVASQMAAGDRNHSEVVTDDIKAAVDYKKTPWVGSIKSGKQERIIIQQRLDRAPLRKPGQVADRFTAAAGIQNRAAE